MQFPFARSPGRPVSNRIIGLIGAAVVLITIAAAGLTVWDLRRRQSKAISRR